MTGMGWVVIVIGILFAVLGISGSAKMKDGGLGIVVSASAGVILIIVGAFMVGAGI